MMRRVACWIALSIFISGCGKTAIQEGGVYGFQGTDGDYTVSKVLAVDRSSVHIRYYREKFKTLPATLDTRKLSVLIGHAPMDHESFLMDAPKLIMVEKVQESELEGYRYFLKATGQQ